MPPRVLHLIKTAQGAPFPIRQIAAMTRAGMQSAVLVPSIGANHASILAAGADVYIGRNDIKALAQPARFMDARRQLLAAIAAFKPDVILAHFVGSVVFARLALGRWHALPRVFQVAGPLHLEHMAPRLFEIGTAGPGDYWLATCRATMQHYGKAGIAADRLGLAYFGLPESAFVQGSPDVLRALLPAAAASRRIVGMVAFAYPPRPLLGRPRGIKGHEDLFEAVRLLVAKGSDVHLVVVGGPAAGGDAYFARLQATGHRLLGDRLTMLGSRDDVLALYPGMDVAVHPSHSENLGAAIESLAQGVPTIATNVGGFPDIVRPGETGWLVPPRTPPALAKAIAEALAEPDEAFRRGQAGRRLIMTEFNDDHAAAGVMAFMTAVVAHRRAQPAPE